MLAMKLKVLLPLLLIGLTFAQEDAPADGGDGGDGGEDKEGGDDCEEAWEFLEFLKNDCKEKIEYILQEKLFQPAGFPEKIVADAMEEVMGIRDSVLDRTKALRTGEIEICPGQGIRQEEFLVELRMDIMSVLLKLIESDAGTSDKLQDVGRSLLSIRTKVNGKVTELIMLREAVPGRSTPDDDCDCGILTTILDSLNAIIGDGEDEEGGEGGDEGAEAPAEGEGEGEGGDNESKVADLTMVLMDVDARIGKLYSDILAQLDEGKRKELEAELQNLKGISANINDVLSELTGEKNEAKINRLLSRDVVRIRNEVDRQLNQCRQSCPTECDSCGAELIDEVLRKLGDYEITLQTLDEEDAKESVRSDLMAYLSRTNERKTKLLEDKINSEDGTLNKCDNETSMVIDKIKGPMWMMVNLTIFGDANTMNEMILALQTALTEMRGEYCTADTRAKLPGPSEDNECDLDEINNAGNWILEIDSIIQENLFKTDDPKTARIQTMLGFVQLNSALDGRVKELFQENLACKEEVGQIKNIYMGQVSKCLAEMMSPKYRFEEKTRGEKVACIKNLRTVIEDRRGVLLMREIERRLGENFVDGSTVEA